MTTRNELEARLREDPYDDGAYLIYADLLQAEGDPRGELIVLDDAARRAPPHEQASWRRRRAALLARHPELAPHAPHGILLVWHLGFVRAIHVEQRISQPVRQLMRHPALAFATTLAVEGAVTDEELAKLVAEVPRTISRFALGTPGRWPWHAHPVDLEAVFAALPRLDELAVNAAPRFAGGARLRVLELGDSSRETLDMFASRRFPALERLAIHAGQPRWGEPPERRELGSLFELPPPRLRELALYAWPDGDAVIAALAGAPLLPQLRVLRMWNAGVTVEGARAIAREAFGHLELLDLSDAGLDPESRRGRLPRRPHGARADQRRAWIVTVAPAG